MQHASLNERQVVDGTWPPKHLEETSGAATCCQVDVQNDGLGVLGLPVVEQRTPGDAKYVQSHSLELLSHVNRHVQDLDMYRGCKQFK